ncbi:MAG: prepilin-type N-terminal cleavage/methylation domain-containing protein [Deltaproteobacteria bacterium]|nr:prepilin-type N-terminal cleavage/methylation domain-containing protein [Deltaproteobacteria bacterium]
MQRLKCFIKNLAKKRKNNTGGFTLVEVMIAISIFTIGILAIASMQISAINGNDSANNLTGATTWAQDRIEELLALPYANVVNGGPINQGMYTISWTVNTCPAAIPAAGNCPAVNCIVPNTKLIIVTVTWQERGANKSICFTNAKPSV